MITLRAPAKVNLVLRVGPLSEDGYHRITTVFQAIDLYDELQLEPAPKTSVEGFDDSLVARALEELGETRRVILRKRIPVAAGLGGGSSDAAAVLRSFAGRREVDELYAIARRLGSDVPFFLSGLETALGTGRGDVLRHLPGMPRGYGLLLLPAAVGLSAAEVYATCAPNPCYRAVQGDVVRGVHIVRDVPRLSAFVTNDLEPAVLALRPELRENLERLRSAGALTAAISGSGPTAFGLFPDRPAAERAAAAIEGSIPASPLEPRASSTIPGTDG